MVPAPFSADCFLPLVAMLILIQDIILRRITISEGTVLIHPVIGQKFTEDREQVWVGYFNQTRLSEKSGIWVDLQLRLNDFLDQKSVSIARLGYTFFLSDAFRLTGGYGRITHYSLNSVSPDVPENRFWQQAQWFHKKRSLSFSQYFRVEERLVREVSSGELTDDSRLPGVFVTMSPLASH